MADKKKPTVNGKKEKPVRLALSERIHHKLRVEAARQGKSMSALAKEIISEKAEKFPD